MDIIVAVNTDWGIGYNNSQSVVLPEDRRHFRDLTNGGIVVAGRITYEDFGRPLPNRKNIVLTRNMEFMADGVLTAHSIEEVLAIIADDNTDKVFIIGGGSVYRQFLPMCSYAHITKIESAPPSDTYFPNLDELPDWTRENIGEKHESGGIWYSFNIYKNNAVIH